MAKRRVEAFTAGCPICEDSVKKVKAAACPDCEVVVDQSSRSSGRLEARTHRAQRRGLHLS